MYLASIKLLSLGASSGSRRMRQASVSAVTPRPFNRSYSTGQFSTDFTRTFIVLVNDHCYMKSVFRRKSVLVVLVLLVLLCGYTLVMPSRSIDYNVDVKPILNKKCISCHGGVEKQGGFSLLFKEEALAETGVSKTRFV